MMRFASRDEQLLRYVTVSRQQAAGRSTALEYRIEEYGFLFFYLLLIMAVALAPALAGQQPR